jgi:predicted component of type VI protein secretion system
MWMLKVVKGAELADQLQVQVQLPQPLQRFTIGRDPSNGWTIADRTLALSGRHCEIVSTPAGPALRDLSTNGTFVNGGTVRLAGEHLLRDGDRFELGPFDIAVIGPPMPTRPSVAPVPVAAPPASAAQGPKTPSNTAPQRGGDPAAMLAMGVEHGTVGLTEILRAAPPADDSGVDMTRIRVAPPPAARAAAAAVPAAPAASEAAPEAITASSLREALARGLGVPVTALDGHALLPLAEQLAAAARSAQAALQGVRLPPPGGTPPR